MGSYGIYNPWSIINDASRRKLESYWINTSANVMIKSALSKCDASFDRMYEQLLEHGYVETLVRVETSFFEANSTPNLLGLFVNAGYLTVTKTISEMDNIPVIRIPNQEVQGEFRTLTSFYSDVSETNLTQLFTALKQGDPDTFTTMYQTLLLTLPAYHDLKDENSYHVLILRNVCKAFQ